MRTPIYGLLLVAACHVVPGAMPDGGTPDSPTTTDGHGTTVQLSMSYPSYDVVGGNYVCSASVMQPINVYAPRAPAGAKLPLLLFFPGTLATATDGISPTIIEHAAALGFVAAAVEYHSYDVLLWPDRMDAKARCVFDSDISGADNVVEQLCNNQGPLATAAVQVDCTKGIVVAGHSQGGVMALLARNYDARVRGAYVLDAPAFYDPSDACTNFLAPGYDVACNMWTSLFPYTADPTIDAAQVGTFTGPALGGANHRMLPSSAIVAEAGDLDPYFTPHAATTVTASDIAVRLDNVTGLSCGAGASCVGPAGNGWYEIDAAQLDAASEVSPFAGAGHCWFSDGTNVACTDGSYVPDPDFTAVGATAAWTLDANLRWLAALTGS